MPSAVAFTLIDAGAPQFAVRTRYEPSLNGPSTRAVEPPAWASGATAAVSVRARASVRIGFDMRPLLMAPGLGPRAPRPPASSHQSREGGRVLTRHHGNALFPGPARHSDAGPIPIAAHQASSAAGSNASTRSRGTS